jgi:hypothetical protein
MRIAWVVPARSAEVSEDGTIDVVGGGLDTLFVKGLPELTSLGVILAMRVAGPAREWLSSHTIAVLLTDDAGAEEVVFQQRLTIIEAPVVDPDRDIGVLVAARCEWRSPRAGAFVLSVQLDGEEEARVPLAVVEEG